MGKLFTSVINQRIIKFVEKQKIVSHYQIGFKKSYRTADYMFVIKTLTNKYLTCVLWILKRLTTVCGEMGYFIYKLINCGFSTKILGILKGLYENTLSCVKLSRGLINSFKSSVGVCQRCNLSPILFNLFINDLMELFSPSNHSYFPVN